MFPDSVSSVGSDVRRAFRDSASGSNILRVASGSPSMWLLISVYLAIQQKNINPDTGFESIFDLHLIGETNKSDKGGLRLSMFIVHPVSVYFLLTQPNATVQCHNKIDFINVTWLQKKNA